MADFFDIFLLKNPVSIVDEYDSLDLTGNAGLILSYMTWRRVLTNISYCAMKLLPYTEETFSQYRNGSVQEFRFALSGQILYVNLIQNIKTHIN